MNLEEIAYMIGGSLRTEDSKKYAGIGGSNVSLFDKRHKLCFIAMANDFCLVRGVGKTIEDARNDLVESLKGKELLYEIGEDSVRGFRRAPRIRIPQTLVSDKEPSPLEIERRRAVSRDLCGNDPVPDYPLV